MSVSNLEDKDAEMNNSMTDWKDELTELEMIKAAKLILLNRNPMFYLRRIHQKKKLIGEIVEEIPDVLKDKTQVDSKPHDSIASLRYDYKVTPQNHKIDKKKKQTSIISLLAERWAGENISNNNSTLNNNIHHESNQSLQLLKRNESKKGSVVTKVIPEEHINDNFKKAIKIFAKSKANKNFSEAFIDKVETVFEDDPSLLYLRVFGNEDNIEGKKVNSLTYNVFNFFEFRKNNNFLKIKHTQRAIDKFFKENFYETNELTRTNEVIFYANKLGGNLWKINCSSPNSFDVWLQKETNATMDNKHFTFGAHFASKKNADFNFRICNISEELFSDLSKMTIFSKSNGNSWNRDIDCIFKDKALCFTFNKSESIEQVEFSLFMPLNITKSIEQMIKRKNKPTQRIEPTQPMESLQRIDKANSQKKKDSLPKIVTRRSINRSSEDIIRNSSIQVLNGLKKNLVDSKTGSSGKIDSKASTEIESDPLIGIQKLEKKKVSMKHDMFS